MASQIMPEISVVMSVYNASKFLQESVGSILNQSFKDFEFIIIDDASTDGSLKIAENFAKIDSMVVLVENKSNLGLTRSLNIGLRMAKGKYIARMDADDISLPERLQVQYNYLEKNQDIFLVGGGAICINEFGEEVKRFVPLISFSEIKKRLKKINCLYHPTVMFRNEEFFYREKFRYTQDYDFYLRLLLAEKRINNIRQPLIKYRHHDHAISSAQKSQQKKFAKMAKRFYRQAIKNGSDDYANFNSSTITK